MAREYVIAYDFGTSSVKAVLADRNTDILGMAVADYSMLTPKLGWAEQNPEEYWAAIIHATAELLRKTGASPQSIKAIAFSTQAMGIIPLDGSGNLLYNNISWVDGRAAAQAEKINAAAGGPLFGPKSVMSKLLWMKEERPDIYDQTRYFLDVNGFLKYKATGNMVAELTGACSYRLDLNALRWDTELFKTAGLDTEKLPPIVPSTAKVGTLTQKAAEELQLPKDTLVVAGCNDVEASAVGAAALGEGKGHIYLGSSAWLCASTEKTVLPRKGVTVSKGADPAKNMVKGVTQSSGMTVDRAIDLLYGYEKRNPRIDEFSVLEEEVRKIAPGSENLIITPWLYGETCPITTESTRSTIFNMTNVHTRAHIMKAVREGIGFNLRWIRDHFKSDFGFSFGELGVIGGGGLSQDWMQCLADILQMPLYTVENMRHAGAIGAAICAMVGCGMYSDFQCAERIVRRKQSYEPRRGTGKQYDNLFYGYKELYFKLAALYDRSNGSRTTGKEQGWILSKQEH